MRVRVLRSSCASSGSRCLIYPLAAKGVPLGLLLALAAGVSWAAGTVYVKWIRFDIRSVGAGVLAGHDRVLSMIAACLMLFDGRLDLDHAHAGSLLATAFAGIVGSGIAYAMWFDDRAGFARGDGVTRHAGNPVVGVLSTALFLGERPTVTDLIGFALIFAASACALWAPSAPARVG